MYFLRGLWGPTRQGQAVSKDKLGNHMCNGMQWFQTAASNLTFMPTGLAPMFTWHRGTRTSRQARASFIIHDAMALAVVIVAFEEAGKLDQGCAAEVVAWRRGFGLRQQGQDLEGEPKDLEPKDLVRKDLVQEKRDLVQPKAEGKEEGERTEKEELLQLVAELEGKLKEKKNDGPG